MIEHLYERMAIIKVTFLNFHILSYYNHYLETYTGNHTIKGFCGVNETGQGNIGKYNTGSHEQWYNNNKADY